MSRRFLLTLLIFAAAAAPALAGVIPDGGEFIVNTYTTAPQKEPEIASAGLGGFVVVWVSEDQDDGSSEGVYGQRYDRFGVPLGGEFLVNSYTISAQFDASVAMHPSGGFVVSWTSLQDGDETGVFARRFDETGSPVGGDFQVNVWTTASQRSSTVAIADDGSFVVTWMGEISSGTGFEIMARRYDMGGAPVGGEFQVNTSTAFHQYFPRVAMSPSGSFAVVWGMDPLDGDGFGVAARLFNSSGAPIGTEFLVNTYTTEDQDDPDVAMDAQGNFVVVWNGDDQDGSIDGVFGQVFAKNGAPIGGEFQVPTYSTDRQFAPRASATPDGEFLVTWTSYDRDGSGMGVAGRVFGPRGTPSSDEFLVNATTAYDQNFPAIAAGPSNDFVVVWQDYYLDGSEETVIGGHFYLPAPALLGPAGPVDCSDPSNPATAPLFTWDENGYDAFKVYLGSSPGFEKGTRVRGGSATSSYMPSRKKWKRACKKVLEQSMDPNSPLMYVAVFGIDKDLSKKEPARKRLGPAVEFGVTP